jgi:GT2 family glycosyltransferase
MNLCDVTIIIVNYNTRELLLNCLRSVYEQTREGFVKVVVVDNASRDGSAATVAGAFPQVELIANTENRGFAAANNQGLRIAEGRYVLLLNPDTIILDQAVEKAVAFADQNPDVAVVGCQVLENEKTIQRTCFAFPSLLGLILAGTGLNRIFPRSRIFARHNMGWWDRDTQREVDVVSGMFFLVRQEAIRRIGLMDEDYFVYAEETDWCWRFWRAGWRCVFFPSARIIHLDGGGKSTAQASVKMYVQLQKSLLLFFRKHLGRCSCFLARMVFILTMAARAAVWSVGSLFTTQSAARQKRIQSAAALQYHLFGREP